MDLKQEELQIRTDSALASERMVNVFFHDANQKHFSDVQIIFGESFIGYHVGYCTPDEFSLRFDNDPSPSDSKTWRIFQEEGSLKIWCNDELVLNYEFPDSGCKSRYSNEVVWVKFGKRTFHIMSIWGNHDTASENYRIAKGENITLFPGINILNPG